MPQALALRPKAAGNSGVLVLDALSNFGTVTGWHGQSLAKAEANASGSEGVLGSLASSRPVIKSGGGESPKWEPSLPPARQTALRDWRTRQLVPATTPVYHLACSAHPGSARCGVCRWQPRD